MSNLVDPADIERIVGVARHHTRHYARAVSAEQTVYILHSERCRRARPDLRECPWSEALDNGIDMEDWRGHEDEPQWVVIGRRGDVFRLIPNVPGMRFSR